VAVNPFQKEHTMIRRAERPVRRRDESGASSVEYAILVSLIAIVIVVAVAFFGQRTASLFQRTCDSVSAAQSTTCS
jgi:Flp pilus assembly pilin Flp